MVVDWNKIKLEYIAGGISYRELAKKHGISFNTLKTHGVKGGWAELKKKKEAKATAKVIEKTSEEEAEYAISVTEVADKLLGRVAKLVEGPIDSQSVKQLTSALKDLKDIKGVKSDADIREQEARIKKLEKEAQAEDNTLTEIKVTFGSDDEESGKWAE